MNDKKPNIELVTKTTEWVIVENARGTWKAIQNDLDLVCTFSHGKDKKTQKMKKKITFRMGHGLLKKLDLENGDRVKLAYDKDDQKNMMLFKHPKGNIISIEKQSEKSHLKIYRLQINGSWCVLDECNNEKISYKVDKDKRIFFRLK